MLNKEISIRKDGEVAVLTRKWANLQQQVDELTRVKDQHEEALSYLLEQVNYLRSKLK